MPNTIDHTKTRNILDKALEGKRLSSEEGLFLWQEGDFYLMGQAANALRLRKTNPQTVSYTAFRVINYSNRCEIECSFCSFMKPTESYKGSHLTFEEVMRKVKESADQDIRQIFFQGGVDPTLPLSYYIDILREIKKHYPQHHIRAFSPVEILHLAKNNGLSDEQLLRKLQAAGLDSLPGAGAEILSDEMRKILSEKKATKEEWLRIMEVAQKNGLKGSANIVWGSVEKPEHILEHLTAIRDLQDKSGGVLSFVPWTFQPQTKNFTTRYVPTKEYLKMVALCRLFLDNIPHIEVSLMVAGLKIGELALHFGADDINSPVFEENVLRSYGLKNIPEAEKFISKAGFTPVRRNFNFEYNRKS